MPRKDGCRAAVLRVETRAASSRITIYFESNHTLLRVEPQSLSVRTTLREACAACMSAMVSGHETHRTGLPEDRTARKTGHIALSPSTPFTRPSSRWRLSTARAERYTVLAVQAAGATGVASDGSHRGAY